MKKYFFTSTIFLLSILLTACSIVGTSSNNKEVEILKNRVDTLSTQNAILMTERESNFVDKESPSDNISQEDVDSEIFIPTPTLESMPTEPIQAGEPISFDGWRLTVSPTIKAGEDWEPSASSGTWSYIKVTLFITNTTNQDRIFRWVKSGLTLYDDLGNSYLPLMPFSVKGCRENYANLNGTSQLTLSSDKRQEIYNNVFWCDHPYTYPFFEGPIDINASTLILSVNNFGPFNDLQFLIDL